MIFLSIYQKEWKYGMRKILLLGTGGTIASQNIGNGLTPALSVDGLLDYVPEAGAICQVTCRQIMNIDSTNMAPNCWQEIATVIEQNYVDYDGFVICHGTDTLAYTAAALSYLIQSSPKPIVLTGSQRPIDISITDAKTNLLDALRYAAHPAAPGVVIVFNGKVMAGTRGKKERTRNYDAFISVNFPDLAVIRDGTILFYFPQPRPVETSPIFYHNLQNRVALLKLIPGMDSGVLDYLARHYDGIIIESFGSGGLPEWNHGSFRKSVQTWLRKGKTIVITTQVLEEGSNLCAYEVGKLVKEEHNLLEAYDMTLEAVTAKLMWILGETDQPEEIARLFYTPVNLDILAKP